MKLAAFLLLRILQFSQGLAFLLCCCCLTWAWEPVHVIKIPLKLNCLDLNYQIFQIPLSCSAACYYNVHCHQGSCDSTQPTWNGEQGILPAIGREVYSVFCIPLMASCVYVPGTSVPVGIGLPVSFTWPVSTGLPGLFCFILILRILFSWEILRNAESLIWRWWSQLIQYNWRAGWGELVADLPDRWGF